MTARLPLRVGSSDQRGDDVTHWQKWARGYAKSYADLMGPVDGYYGDSDATFTREMQRRLDLPQTGIFDETTAGRVGYAGMKVAPRRKIWIYTAPGSGADWWVGPSFELGEWCKKVLHLNHQPIGFPKGGYLGLMGGDPTFSYNEVIAAEGMELERLLAANPDIDDPDFEVWFSGYSQSADGMEDALVRLFGDGGKYAHLRGRINGVIQFGNPSKKDTGIARKQRPQWLYDLVINVTTKGDFYAEVPVADKIRPAFYAIIVQAEMELPFFVHVLRVAVPVILSYTPVMGLFGPLGQLAVAAVTGLNAAMPLLGKMFGQAGAPGDEKVDQDLIRLLTPQGVLTNIPGLIGLVAALPGLQAHGEYHLPKPEFNGRTGIQVGCDIVAAFRR